MIESWPCGVTCARDKGRSLAHVYPPTTVMPKAEPPALHMRYSAVVKSLMGVHTTTFSLCVTDEGRERGQIKTAIDE